MRKLAVSTFLTSTASCRRRRGPEEDPAGGFTHGGWSVNYWDDAMGQAMGEAMGRPFDLLLGRKTYEIFAAHWPHATDEPGADVLNNAEVRRLQDPRQRRLAESTLLEGDAADAVARLKEEDGPEIQVHGSGDLIQTLLERDLVDEFRLMVFPVVLGAGKRLFAEGTIPAG